MKTSNRPSAPRASRSTCSANVRPFARKRSGRPLWSTAAASEMKRSGRPLWSTAAVVRVKWSGRPLWSTAAAFPVARSSPVELKLDRYKATARSAAVTLAAAASGRDSRFRSRSRIDVHDDAVLHTVGEVDAADDEEVARCSRNGQRTDGRASGDRAAHVTR